MSSWWVLSPAAILPNSVRAPVATTTPRPLPACTTVPISAHPDSSASGVPCRHGAGVLVDGQRLAGQHRLVALQAGDLEQPEVGRDDVAEPQLDQVAGHQGGDVHRGRPPVADDHRLVVDLGVQRLGGLLGPVLVDEAEPDRQADDHADDDGVAALADEVGRDRGGQQQPEQRGPQLMPEHRQQPGAVRGHRIRAVLLESPRDLVLGQPGLGSHTKPAQYVGHGRRGGLGDPRHSPDRVRRSRDGHSKPRQRLFVIKRGC